MPVGGVQDLSELPGSLCGGGEVGGGLVDDPARVGVVVGPDPAGVVFGGQPAVQLPQELREPGDQVALVERVEHGEVGV